jgi:hypothetical protein
LFKIVVTPLDAHMHEKRNFRFDPETIALMKKAFEDACARIPPRRPVARSILAERILQAAANGERDPVRLRTRALVGVVADAG